MKLKKFTDVEMLNEVREIVVNAYMLLLVDCSLTMLDVPLLSAIVERWHKDISSLHLLFGEITITMDDVSRLFYIPLTSNFFTTPLINQKLACTTTEQYLWVTKAMVIEEYGFNRGVSLPSLLA